MCGRFVVDIKEGDWAAITADFGLGESPAPAARFNLAPTQAMPGLCLDGDAKGQPSAPRGHVQHRPLTFGMKLGSSSLVINARSETLTEKPMFRHLLTSHRVLVPATSFYEWAPAVAGKKTKQPMCFARPGQVPFFFAALREKRAAERPGAVLITTAANAVVAPSHARMPVMLTTAEGLAWLDARTEVGEALALLQPYADEMTAWPVGLQVNSPRHDAPDCVARAAAAEPA